MLQYLIDKEVWLKYRNNMTYPQDNKIYQCYLQKEKVIHRRKGEILMKNEVQVFQNEEFGEVRKRLILPLESLQVYRINLLV
jgi:hypothetical protein